MTRGFCNGVCLLLFLIGFASCGSEEGFKDLSYSPSTTDTLPINSREVRTKISLPTSVLEEYLNKKLGKQLVDATLEEVSVLDSAQLNIKRLNTVKLRLRGGKMHVDIHLSVNLKVYKQLAGVQILNGKQISTEAILKLITPVDLNSQWEIITDFSLDTLVFKEEPVVEYKLIDVSLSGAVRKYIRTREEQITSKLNEAIKEEIPLREELNKIWLTLQKPMRITDKTPEPFFLLSLGKVSGRLDLTTNDSIFFYVAINSHGEIIFDSSSGEKSKLPAYTKRSKLENSSFIFDAFVDLPYATIENMLAEKFVGSKVNYEDRTVKVDSVDVFGTEGLLYLDCWYSGDVTGRLRASGTPKVDMDSLVLLVDNFDFQVRMESTILNKLEEAFHSLLMEQIKDKLQVSLAQFVDSLPHTIEQAVAKGKAGKRINFYVEQIDAIDYKLFVAEKKVKIRVSAEARCSILIHQLGKEQMPSLPAFNF